MSKHLTLCGNPGMGKSTTFMHIMDEIERRGEVAIVVGDPKAEYFKRYYRPERGDVVFDPANDKCCYWALEEEAKDRARAESWGLSFIPDPPGQDENFFPKNARAAMSGLISRHNVWNAPDDPATCENLARWIGSAESELMRRLMKIPGLKAAFAKDSPNQFNGLTGTMAPLVPGLGMMPRKCERRPKFTVREYAERRTGAWIFVTSSPDTRDATRAMQTAVVDNLLRAIEGERPGAKRIWVLCDELSLMKRMTRLQEAAAMLRASGNVLVMGFQNSAQVALLYGENGMKALLGMAYTQAAFGTVDPEIQKHLEQQFGYTEVERLTENRPVHVMIGSKQSRSASVSSQQIQNVPVVSATQVGSLAPYWFFVKQGEFVVRARIKKNNRPVVHPYIERIIPELIEAELESADDEDPETSEIKCVPVDIAAPEHDEEIVAVPVDDVPPGRISLRPRRKAKNGTRDLIVDQLSFRNVDAVDSENEEVPVD